MSSHRSSHSTDELSRRDFLPIAAGAVIASSVASVASMARADESSKLPRLKKAVKYAMVQTKGSAVEKFKLLKKIGFQGVEIDIPSGLDLDELVAARDATGVVVHGVIDSVHWSKPLSDPRESVRQEGLQALKTALKAANKVGADTVLLVPGVVNKEVSYKQCWDRSTAEVKKVIADAEKAKAKIAIEVVWNNFLTKPEQLIEYVDQFESPWVGAYFDCSNMIKYGVPSATWIRKIGKRMLKFDFKGYSVAKAKAAKNEWKGFDVGIGEGDENWPEILKACSEVGYHTWATAEVGGGGEKWLREVSARMDKILELT